MSTTKTVRKHDIVFVSWNSINVLERVSRFTLGLNVAKIIDYIAKCFKRNCAGLNFLQKTQGKRISFCPKSGARGSKDLSFLRYYNALEWESWVSLGLNALQNDAYKRCTELNFLQKTQWKHFSIYSRSEGTGSKDLVLWFYQKVYLKMNTILHNFIVSFLFIFQLLLHLIFIVPIKYMVWDLKVMHIFRSQLPYRITR